MLVIVLLIGAIFLVAIVGYYLYSKRERNVDCDFTYGTWRDCDCATFQQSRSNIINTEAEGTGATCPPKTETRTCPESARPAGCIAEDCQFVSGNWSACSKTCGGGKRTRTNSITQQASGGGVTCPPVNESESCMTQTCVPQNCEFTWPTEWSECSKTCGGGIQEKRPIITREAANGGQACPTILIQDCNEQPCWQRLVNANESAGHGFNGTVFGRLSKCTEGTTDPECLWQVVPLESSHNHAQNFNYISENADISLLKNKNDFFIKRQNGVPEIDSFLTTTTVQNQYLQQTMDLEKVPITGCYYQGTTAIDPMKCGFMLKDDKRITNLSDDYPSHYDRTQPQPYPIVSGFNTPLLALDGSVNKLRSETTANQNFEWALKP